MPNAEWPTEHSAFGISPVPQQALQMINAVLFDLFETLITESDLQPTRASSLAAALGLENQAYRREWKARRPRIIVGALSFADALTEISQMLAGRVDREAVQRIVEQRIREKSAAYAHMNLQIITVVTNLAQRGIRLAVISNGFKEDVLPWGGCSLAPAFQCTAFSCEEGLAKPNPEIYRRAMHRLEVDPDTAVYIGDGGDNELAGAEHAGLRGYRAAWFVRESPRQGAWPELTACEDVLRLEAAG
jgi:HAD superfamily hydrolase (TIGR01549 family)